MRPRKTKETEAMKPKDKTKEKAVKDEKSNEKVKAKPSVQCKIPLDGLMMSYSEDQVNAKFAHFRSSTNFIFNFRNQILGLVGKRACTSQKYLGKYLPA